MKIFIGLVGRCRQGLDSASRGEGRWALNLARCLKDYDNEIVMAPDMEEFNWGSCPIPPNVRALQAYEKRDLWNQHFDIAIFTSWSTPKPEAQYINADKYVWGVMGWKNGVIFAPLQWFKLYTKKLKIKNPLLITHLLYLMNATQYQQIQLIKLQ